MFFSKSFGYAVRSVLYIASVQQENRYVQLEEIATRLGLPKQFMGRVLKILAKEKILLSFKGPTGGFAIDKNGLKMPLMRILEITDGNKLEKCILKSRNCNALNPCPVHFQFAKIRDDVGRVLRDTTIAELVSGKQQDFIKSLSEINGKGHNKT